MKFFQVLFPLSIISINPIQEPISLIKIQSTTTNIISITDGQILWRKICFLKA